MKTFSAKPTDIERKWYVIDAENKVLGQVAVEAARLLRGKHKAIFTPHIDTGDFVVVINADKVVLLEQLVHEIEVFCRPADLPERLINDVESLGLGQTLKVGDLNLPQGVTVKMDGEVLVAIVNQTRASVSQAQSAVS